jgi:hypothetical protein
MAITLENVGESLLRIHNVALVGDAFGLDLDVSRLSAGESANGNITFRSGEVRVFEGSLQITTNAAGDGILNVPLRAEILPPPQPIDGSGTVAISPPNPSIADEITLTFSADFPRSNSAITNQVFLKDLESDEFSVTFPPFPFRFRW